MKNVLIYNKPAKNFNDAIPIGNGHIGAMVFGSANMNDRCVETIILNDDSVWSKNNNSIRDNKEGLTGFKEVRKLLLDGRIEDAEHVCRCKMLSAPREQAVYQPLGELHITLKGHERKYSDYIRFLDMNTGVTVTEYTIGETTYRREVFVSSADDVLVIRMTADKKNALSLYVNFTRRPFDGAVVADADGVKIINQAGANGTKFVVSIKSMGKSEVLGDIISINNEDEVVLIVSSATNYFNDDPMDKAEKTASMAKNKTYEELLSAHVDAYRSLFSRMDFELGNIKERFPFEFSNEYISNVIKQIREKEFYTVPELLQNAKTSSSLEKLVELYFQFGRYLMISSSNGKCLPANLQGIWNDSFVPPWESKYTININTQMNYWIAEVCNLSECHNPLFMLLDKAIENGRLTARNMYNCRGFVIHNNTDAFGDCSITGELLTAAVWPMGGAWLSLHLWEHYRYTQDVVFLKEKVYKILKECITFFEDYLYENTDGYLLTGPSVSPENTYMTKNGDKGSLCMSPTMDVEILDELFEAFLQCCDIIEMKDEFYDKVVVMKEKLPPITINSEGRISEWFDDVKETEPGHRHISHLFALFPGTKITERNKELFEAAKKTLQARIENGSGHTGWSCAWICNFWARLLDGAKSYEYLKDLLSKCTLDNLLDCHPPFQIDGNFGGVAAIAEMLMQSHESFIRLLPALPLEWVNGKICGLRTRGGHKIDIYWKNAALDYAVVYPMKGKECLIAYNQPIISNDIQCVKNDNLYILDLSNSGKSQYIVKTAK